MDDQNLAFGEIVRGHDAIFATVFEQSDGDREKDFGPTRKAVTEERHRICTAS
ncbi:hypothetical protein [Mesorhizobium sp.]|uniref:hypothetical protein n=1 Tax=Mesorhizobium sp. TaxID=1871066 RepID=UPI0025E15C4C|nr:hypothetical protein [Mesorhizobium sp.]